MGNLYKDYSIEEKIKEIGAIAAVMAADTFSDAYEPLKDAHGGIIGLSFDYADWAIEFFNLHLNSVWEDFAECWDELAINFALAKIKALVK